MTTLRRGGRRSRCPPSPRHHSGPRSPSPQCTGGCSHRSVPAQRAAWSCSSPQGSGRRGPSGPPGTRRSGSPGCRRGTGRPAWRSGCPTTSGHRNGHSSRGERRRTAGRGGPTAASSGPAPGRAAAQQRPVPGVGPTSCGPSPPSVRVRAAPRPREAHPGMTLQRSPDARSSPTHSAPTGNGGPEVHPTSPRGSRETLWG